MIFPFAALVGIGVRAHGNVVAGPATRREFGSETFDGVDLDHDAPLEVLADVETEVLVGWPGKAIGAGVTATAIDVNRIAERHPGCPWHLVDDRPGVDMEELHAPKLA